MDKKEWFDGLQALRGILFLLVFISHSGDFFPSNGAWGGAAVEIFFVLSGFLSGYFYDETVRLSLANCFLSLKKKIMAFWPLYMIMLFVSVYYRNDGLATFIKCIFLTQSYFGNTETALSFNWPSWFLSSILLSYFLSPVLNKLCKKIESKSLLLMLLLFMFQISFAFYWKNMAEPYSFGYYYIYISTS